MKLPMRTCQWISCKFKQVSSIAKSERAIGRQLSEHGAPTLLFRLRSVDNGIHSRVRARKRKGSSCSSNSSKHGSSDHCGTARKKRSYQVRLVRKLIDNEETGRSGNRLAPEVLQEPPFPPQPTGPARPGWGDTRIYDSND